MALSPREQRILAEMDAHLSRDDGRLARLLTSFGQPSYRWAVGVLAWVLGAALVLAVGNMVHNRVVLLAAACALAGVPLGFLAGLRHRLWL